MSTLTPDHEQQIIDVLIACGWSATEQSLKAEGVRTIEGLLKCSAEQAEKTLSDLQDRKLVEPDITRGAELDARKSMPIAQWRWMRP